MSTAPTLVRVFIVDQSISAESLGCLLQPHFKVAGLATNNELALAQVQKLRPDVLLLDPCVDPLRPLHLLHELRATDVSVRTVVLSQDAHRFALAQALRAGASGFVLRQQRSAHLFRAIRSVAAGHTYIAPQLRADLPWAQSLQTVSRRRRRSTLSPRQCEVLHLVAEGQTNREIAARLDISHKTVEFHRTSITRELGLRSIAELSRYALQSGIV